MTKLLLFLFGSCVWYWIWFYIMKYYIIAGEASGDLHGSNLIKALKKEDPTADIRCWGGDLMEQAGGVLAKHYKDMAFMGFLEVIMNIPTIFKNIRYCKEDIEAFRPDVIIFIDFFDLKFMITVIDFYLVDFWN